VIAVVKADAYGHGAVPVVRALLEAGCRRFAVLHVEEACELRDAGIEAPILVLAGVDGAAELAVERRLTPVIHHATELALLAAAARASGSPLPIHVEVDTGMGRMGAAPRDAEALLVAAAEAPGLELEGVFTHLARADEPDITPSLAQLASFRRLLTAARARGVAPALVHVANSAGLLAGKPLLEALPEVNAVRPGLMLYGVRPAPHLDAALRPVLTLCTRVASVRSLAAGDPVGYASLWRAEWPTRVATLRVGYADGVPVAASNRGEVLIGGHRHPIVGRVSMDYLSVEVGDAPVARGDEAIVFGAGEQGELPVEEAAAAAHTIAYELLVRVGARVPRVYTG
jgi:alanine racemase